MSFDVYSLVACWLVLGCIFYAAYSLCLFIVVPHPILYQLESFARPMKGSFAASVAGICASLRNDLSISVIQNMNLSNVAMFGLYCLVFILIVLADNMLIVFKEGLRKKAKLPSDEVIKYYSSVSYENDMAVVRNVCRVRKDPFTYEVSYR